MMRHLLLLFLTYMALVLDAGSSGWALPEGTSPQFLLTVAAISLLLCSGAAAIFWAALIGIACDSFVPGPIGLNVVLLANLAFFAQVFGIRALRDSAFASAALVWVFVTLAALSSLLLQCLLRGDPLSLEYLARYAAGRAGASAALVLLLMLSGKAAHRSLRFVLPSTRAGSERRGWST